MPLSPLHLDHSCSPCAGVKVCQTSGHALDDLLIGAGRDTVAFGVYPLPIFSGSVQPYIKKLCSWVPTVFWNFGQELWQAWHKSSQLMFPIRSVLGACFYFSNGNFEASPEAALNGYPKFNVTQLKHTGGTRNIFSSTPIGRVPC